MEQPQAQKAYEQSAEFLKLAGEPDLDALGAAFICLATQAWKAIGSPDYNADRAGRCEKSQSETAFFEKIAECPNAVIGSFHI